MCYLDRSQKRNVRTASVNSDPENSMDTKAMGTLNSDLSGWLPRLSQSLRRRVESNNRTSKSLCPGGPQMHDDGNETTPGLLIRTWAKVRAHVPDLAELYEAIRDLLLGISLGVATALLAYFSFSQGFVGLLPGGWARLLPTRTVRPPDFLNLGLTVGGIAVSLLGGLILAWVLIRLFILWWRGEFRGILWIWWFTTALWLYQSKGVFRPQLIWPTLPLLFTMAVVMAQIAKRKEG